MLRISVWTVCFVTGLSAGCEGRAAQPEAAPEWQAKLKQLATSGQSSFSYRFQQPSPDGYSYRATIQLAPPETICARYLGSGGTDDGDGVWLLDINVGNRGPGTYQVVNRSPEEFPSYTARVKLLHRFKGAYVVDYSAVRGTVTIDAPVDPNPEDRLPIKLDLEFPKHPLQSLECIGGQSADGGQINEECRCRDEAGQTIACIPSVSGRSCCNDLENSNETIQVAARVESHFCLAMCAWRADLPNYCANLRP